MVDVSGVWSEDGVAEFLRSTTVPIRLGTRRPDASLWIVSLWFRYRDGVFECATGAKSGVVRYLREDAAVAFDVSTNHPPYRGVRGNGHAEVAPDPEKAVLRDLLDRYLGGTDGDLARWLLDDAREEVRIRVEPQSMYTWDFSERMGEGGRP